MSPRTVRTLWSSAVREKVRTGQASRSRCKTGRDKGIYVDARFTSSYAFTAYARERWHRWHVRCVFYCVCMCMYIYLSTYTGCIRRNRTTMRATLCEFADKTTELAAHCIHICVHLKYIYIYMHFETSFQKFALTYKYLNKSKAQLLKSSRSVVARCDKSLTKSLN